MQRQILYPRGKTAKRASVRKPENRQKVTLDHFVMVRIHARQPSASKAERAPIRVCETSLWAPIRCRSAALSIWPLTPLPEADGHWGLSHLADCRTAARESPGRGKASRPAGTSAQAEARPW